MNIGWFLDDVSRLSPMCSVFRPQPSRALLASNGFQTPFEGSAPTFRMRMGLPLKLDWLFLKQLDPIVWNVDAVRLTDHRGVWAQVRARPVTGTSCS